MAHSALTPTTSSARAGRLLSALTDALPRSPRLILLCGPPGVGKSELVRAAVNRFRARMPAATIVETDGERVAESMIEAVHHDALGAYRRRFTRADLIAVDDLHALRGKPRTQTEVAALLLTALDRGARVVCAVGSPGEVPILATAVRRSARAQIVRIPRATSRDARRILAAMARTGGLALTDATLAELAARSRGDLRLGIGALTRLRFDRLRSTRRPAHRPNAREP